jgi:hypothetical protein
MALIFRQNMPQLNSKKRKKNRLHFYKTFAFIPAAAAIESGVGLR